MKGQTIKKQGSILAYLIFSLVAISIQAQNNEICEDDDCSPAVFDIKIDKPLKPTPPDIFSSQRTEQFKQAYQSFQQIRSGYANNEDWQSKHDASMLGGQSSMRYYQLEALFAHEYVQNPDFKSYIDGQSGNSTQFLEDGFESSRRGLNLATRMRRNCMNEVKDLEKKNGPPLDDLPSIYNKLGIELGYFDDHGNMLKPMESLEKKEEEKPKADWSGLKKKDKVSQLKDEVAILPIDQGMRDKIAEKREALDGARPSLDQVQTDLGQMNSQLTAPDPDPAELLVKINADRVNLRVLQAEERKLPFLDLEENIDRLSDHGNDLSNQAEKLVGKSNKLQSKHDDLQNQTNALQEKIDERMAAIDELDAKREELAQRKDELTVTLNDRPKKIIDELKAQVDDVNQQAVELVKALEEECKKKDKLLGEVEDLTAAKDKASEEMNDLNSSTAALADEQTRFEEETQRVEKEAEEARRIEKKVVALQKALAELKPEEQLKADIATCKENLKTLQSELEEQAEQLGKFNQDLERLSSRPDQQQSRLSELRQLNDQLQLPQNDIPVTETKLKKLDQFTEEANAIGSSVEDLSVKRTAMEQSESISQKMEQLRGQFDPKLEELELLTAEINKLVAEKSILEEQLGQTTENVEEVETTVQDFIQRYNSLGEKTDCGNQDDLNGNLAEIKNGRVEAGQEMEELEEEFDNVDEQIDQMEQRTKQLEQSIADDVQSAVELKREEEAMKEEYGADVALEPVTSKEWSEGFMVDRSYWDAMFHPDDEVVEGQKGRYFEVQLKDADKNVKLLFGPGEYCMSKADFRKKYGPAVGSFVTEVLHALNEREQQQVKLYIQGSADKTGHSTFSGNFDERYFFNEISVLPQKPSGERFGNEPIMKEIPERFRNQHLPDLRAQFLKQMITVYSKKLEPTLLEGAVKDFQSEAERNVTIYLFFPEQL